MNLLSAVVLLAVFAACLGVGDAQKQCPNAPSSPQDRRPVKSSLKIVTYNGEWLFLNRSNCPGSGCPWRNLPEAELHFAEVAAELLVLNADIVNVVEVQDCSALVYLNSLVTSLRYVPYLLTGTDTATGQNVGILTRVDPVASLQRTTNRVDYPIPGSTCGSDYSGDSAVSKHYFTTFNVQGLPKPLTLIGLHFLAFPDDPIRCVQREAQASVIQGLVRSALSAGHSVVVLGDFNDFDQTVQDASDNIPISEVFNLIRNPVASAPGDELLNVGRYVSNIGARYSCWYDRDEDCKVEPGELSLIDHILISNDLVPYVSSAAADHSYQASCGSFESDHWPVFVQFVSSSNRLVSV